MRDNVGGFYGGGLTNEGNLTMINCAVHGNRMPGMINRPASMSAGEGGGIRSSRGRGLGMPTTTLINSRVYNNSAGDGGGIVVIDSGITLINSTVFNNTANGDADSSTVENDDGGQGGGILHNCQMACRECLPRR